MYGHVRAQIMKSYYSAIMHKVSGEIFNLQSSNSKQSRRIRSHVIIIKS